MDDTRPVRRRIRITADTLDDYFADSDSDSDPFQSDDGDADPDVDEVRLEAGSISTSSDVDDHDDHSDDDPEDTVPLANFVVVRHRREGDVRAAEHYTANIRWVKVDRAPNLLNFEEHTNDMVVTTDEVNEATTPLQFFQLFFTEEVFQLIAEESVRYARLLGDNTFNTTPAESKIYWGLCLLMGIVRKPDIAMYWSSNEFLSTPIFPKIMTRERFQHLCRYLHFSDNNATHDNPDKLAKLRKFYNMITESFHNCAKPGEVISIDEALIRFFGRISFRTYNASKPAKYGLKAYKLCDEKGYTYKFDLYTATPPEPRADGLKGVVAIVFDLLDGYLDKGRKLYMDNWYNSPELFLRLLQRKTQAAGTVRLNRKGMPKELAQKKKGKKGK